MESLIIFISKSALLISFFLLVYLLVLKRDTSFQMNRIFLLAGILTSFSLPAVEFTRKVIVETSFLTSHLQQFSPGESIPTNAAGTDADWWFITGVLYLLGVAFLISRLLLQLLSLASFLRKAERSEENGFTFYKTEKKVSPFSFFKFIVYNPELHHPRELDLILRHEKAHARQWHSVDVLLSNLAACLLWFNPLVWVYKKYLLQNLEFLADRETVAASGLKKEYQRALVQATVEGFSPVLANHFYQSLIKKRIIMLNKETTSKNTIWKAGLILPFLTAFILGFQVRTEAQVAAIEPQINMTETVPEEEFSITLTAESSQESLENLSRLFRKRGIELSFNSVKRNADGLITSIQVSFRKTNSAQTGNYSQNNSGGIQPFRFYSKENGETGFQSLQEQSKMNVKKRMDQDRSAAGEMTNNSVSTSTKTDSFNIKRHDESKLATGVHANAVPSNQSEAIHRSAVDYQSQKPLFLVDGKEQPKDFNPDQIDPENIKSINVLKNESATKKYGDKGKYGVIEINLKKEGEEQEQQKTESPKKENTYKAEKITIQTTVDSSSAKESNVTMSGVRNTGFRQDSTLYVLDGKVLDKNFDLSTLNPENIDSIVVLKGDKAVDKYGKKAAEGVIEINTKG